MLNIVYSFNGEWLQCDGVDTLFVENATPEVMQALVLEYQNLNDKPISKYTQMTAFSNGQMSVSMRQCRQILLSEGLLSTVDTFIKNMTGIDGDNMRIFWEYSTEIKRYHPMIEKISQGLNLSEAKIDDLFTSSSKL